VQILVQQQVGAPARIASRILLAKQVFDLALE
jgi:hypothetical protein